MRIAILCLSCLFCLCIASFCFAGPPDAGTLLRENRQVPESRPKEAKPLPEQKEETSASEPVADIKIPVSDIHITGVTVFPSAQVQALVADAAGQALTLDELAEYARKITQYYNENSYPLARAYIPAQQLTNGRVEIAVIEGRIGRVTMDNQSKIADSLLNAYLKDIKSGEILLGTAMEKDLLLLSDLKGIQVNSSLRPGESVGTTDLDIRVSPGKTFSGNVFIDNYGNSFSGEFRAGADLVLGNPASLGDTLALQVNTSEGLFYARGAWQVPLGPGGTQLGGALSVMNYQLGQDYKDLDAHGDAVIGDLYLLTPLIRSRNLNLNSQVVCSHKVLDDDIDNADIHSSKRIDLLTFGLSLSSRDNWLGGGLTKARTAFSAGHLDLDHENSVLDAETYRTAGKFGRFNAGFTRLQSLGGHWDLLVDLRGQLASDNLDSAEKMSLGGPTGVRAYPQGEAPSDDAWLATVELGCFILDQLKASAFYDRARGRIIHDPLNSDIDNIRDLAGYGLGLSYTPENFLVRAGVAWRSKDAPVSDKDRKPRIWAQAVWYF